MDSCKLQVEQQVFETNTEDIANVAVDDDDNKNNSIYDDESSTASHNSLWQKLADVIETKI